MARRNDSISKGFLRGRCIAAAEAAGLTELALEAFAWATYWKALGELSMGQLADLHSLIVRAHEALGHDTVEINLGIYFE